MKHRCWIVTLAGCLCASGVASSSEAVPDDIFSCYKSSSRAEPDWAAVSRDYAQNRFRRGCAVPRSVEAPADAVALRTMAPRTGAASVKPVVSPPPAPVSDFIWVVRKDFADVGIFSKPVPNVEADGAEFSWTRNNVTQDSIWQVDGLVALAYNYSSEDYSSFIGLSVASYVKVNKEIHSAASASDSNSDVITVGGSGEIGFNNPIKGADYFRARWSQTQDNVLGKTTSQVTGVWMPTYLQLNRELPGFFLTYNFRPDLKVQFDYQQGGLTPIGFSGLDRSLRVGPEATLRFRVTDFGGVLPDWAKPLSSLSGSITYHWWTEVYSGNRGSWLDSTIKYDINPNVALAFNYRKGRQEETAKRTDLYKISLNFKTCAGVFGYSGDACNAMEPEASE